MENELIYTFKEFNEKNRQSPYNGTRPVSSITLNGQSILLGVEKASMAVEVNIHESLDADAPIRPQVFNSLEKSLKDNSAVWDELSKH